MCVCSQVLALIFTSAVIACSNALMKTFFIRALLQEIATDIHSGRYLPSVYMHVYVESKHYLKSRPQTICACNLLYWSTVSLPGFIYRRPGFNCVV